MTVFDRAIGTESPARAASLLWRGVVSEKSIALQRNDLCKSDILLRMIEAICLKLLLIRLVT